MAHQLFDNQSANGDSSEYPWPGGKGFWKVRRNAGSGTVTFKFKPDGDTQHDAINETEFVVTDSFERDFNLPSGTIINTLSDAASADFDTFVDRVAGLRDL